MTNEQIIKSFINGEHFYYGANHLLIDGNSLYNYSTVLAVLDRKVKKAKFNKNKYSRTTSKIQNMIFNELVKAGFDIEKSDDFSFGGYWNYGYQGAPVYKSNGSTRW